MLPETPFDQEYQLRRTRACQEFLRDFLTYVKVSGDRRDALDVGCGVGLLSGTLLDMGFSVTAIDARLENILEARRRFPNAKFHVLDVESESLAGEGRFHVVLCFGLLYHLENPFRLMRDLFNVTDDFLILESVIAPGDEPTMILMNEPEGADMSLNSIAFVPTENCLVKMCYQAGFTQVYRPNIQASPRDHNFHNSLFRRRHRAILVAAKDDRPSHWNQEPVPEPYTMRPDLWTRTPGHIRRQAIKRIPRPVLKIIKNIRDGLTLRG